ncbi:MAG: hypothetical protein GY724_11235 [Actinomycetia bacterium]|nr:hypothetical protein [Actinomycetes bacterium]MCP4224988.1 hypothetical protein [Actinomycetes bacterium]MCP5030246.1 hypothetical protein [Actinomycetes bacterium]
MSDAELETLGVEIVERFGSGIRGLLVPAATMLNYQQLVAERLECGYWNNLVRPRQILFTYKLADGTVKALTLSPRNGEEIARLCSQLNGDPLEKTRDLPSYLVRDSAQVIPR